jgi:hypothetical protein
MIVKKPGRPRDPSQLAKLILDMTTGDVANDLRDPNALLVEYPPNHRATCS